MDTTFTGVAQLSSKVATHLMVFGEGLQTSCSAQEVQHVPYVYTCINHKSYGTEEGEMTRNMLLNTHTAHEKL